ncbi:hypothetical protein [Agaribacter marinus]|uniref:Uncharacterized protein n=1 Tax=Agaribacter marinus TaxID=1431249 RepID=A0AA37T575_9ALTE|nr:hypothetical protein [Agaribacter marinus]GLR71635.1 hypothetical protein GCM10007852_25430 [Agaribacter marinus]
MSWKYVSNENDEKYCLPLPESQTLSESDLPKNEFDLRAKLAFWQMNFFVPFNSLGWFEKHLDSKNYKEVKTKLDHADQELIEIIASPENHAALKRILSVMPEHVPQKRYLVDHVLSLG